MSKKIITMRKIVMLLFIMVWGMSRAVYAEEDTENVNVEQQSFVEDECQQNENDEFDQFVDGIYNVGKNARTSMSGVIRLGKSENKLVANYSTDYTHAVDRIGVKNIKLQYKGSLGLWHDVITLDNKYRTNAAAYMGAFSCNGVVGRTYRLKGTHYIIEGSYKEERDNVTLGLTFN